MEFADERTLQALDFDMVRARLADFAQSERGREEALELIPQAHWPRAAELGAGVTEMRALVAGGFSLGRIPATETILARARRSLTLSAEELGELGKALKATDLAIRAVRATELPRLRKLVDPARSVRELAEDLEVAFGPRGELLDGASPELGRIRRGLQNAIDAARSRAVAIAGSAKLRPALQDTIVTQRADRFVVPVKAEFIGTVPGIVHDSSASGQTVFVEPLGVVEANNRVRTLALEEQHEISRILVRFTSRVSKEAALLAQAFAVAVELDGLYARARLANDMQAVEPILASEPGLVLVAARHPLLTTAPVPQTLALSETQALIIISGPNMGGKTVALKLVALIVVMAACGMHVPALPGTTIGPFTHVIADVGDAQSLAASTSTFAAHLRRLRTMLERAQPGLLFVVDEIASGTETASGAALAIALLDDMLETGAFGIVTTHAQELKTYAQQRPRVVNAGMRFLPTTHTPTFELDIGVPGRSLALDLAAREGFPADLLERARLQIGAQESAYDEALAELSSARADVSAARAQLAAEELHQREATRLFERERAEFASERDRRLNAADQQLRATLEDFATELRSRTPQSAKRIGRSQIELLGSARAKLESNFALGPQAQRLQTPPFQPAVGMVVQVRGYTQPATITEIKEKHIIVSLGAMHMSVARDAVSALPEVLRVNQSLKRHRPPSDTKDSSKHEQALERISSAAMELDVRGHRLHEALPLVERWIDQAMQAGVSPLRLIHGKGTGALGQGLQSELENHPRVIDIRYGNETEGGGGVSIISIR